MKNKLKVEYSLDSERIKANLISVSFSEWNSDPHSIGGPLLEELFYFPDDQFETSEIDENIGKIDESIILNFGHV